MGNGIFSYNGFFSRAINGIIDSICLSLLWLIFSLPIITLGASTTALYYAVNKVLIRDKSHIFKEFWSSFKQNFVQSTIIWACLLVFLIIFGLNTYYGFVFFLNGKLPKLFLLAILVVSGLVLAWASYLFPYIARFKNTIRETLSNCFFLFVRHFFKSLLLLALLLGCVIAVWSHFPVLFIIPVAWAGLSNFILERIFRKYMSEEDAEADAKDRRVTQG